MLSFGTKDTKNLCVLIALVVIAFAVGVLWICILFKVTSQAPQHYPSPEEYYNKMLSLQEISDKVKVSDVFEFDFDEAYVCADPYGDEAYYLDLLNVDTNVPIFRWETGGHYRIFFIKDRNIIYDFVYETTKVDMLEKGMMIYPNTTMTLTQAFFSNGDSYLQITFQQDREQ